MWQYYHDMKRTYHNHDLEGYIDYHDIRYILHITTQYTHYTVKIEWVCYNCFVAIVREQIKGAL